MAPPGEVQGEPPDAAAHKAFGAPAIATAINDSGQVVGDASTASGEYHAFVWTQAGGMVDLNDQIPTAPAGTELYYGLALSDNGSLAGRATFGFVSKYKKGATVPTGNTEFQFHAAHLNFHSENYDWLVVSGARAQYKGTGTISGAGTFKFMLTAIDGQINGGGVDRFRIKIWHYDATLEADVVDYDNQINLSEEASATEGTTIGGGSIVIHTK